MKKQLLTIKNYNFLDYQYKNTKVVIDINNKTDEVLKEGDAMETAIISILIFGVSVIFHEFGHFSVAKFIGVKVEEFAIGMGPKLFGFKRGETVYSLRILPLGGFCKMLGEDEDSEDTRSLNNQSKLARVMILGAGSFMNIILAILLLVFVFYSIGTATTTIKEVDEKYPAYQNGIRAEDKIVKINDTKIEKYDQIESIITKNEKNELSITIDRKGDLKEISLQPKFDENLERYRIGIVPKTQSSILYALETSAKQTLQISKMILSYLGQLIIGKGDTESLVGPIGIVSIVNETAKNGLLPVIHLGAMISLNLAIFNLLPIPALDGSRLMFIGIEAIRGKPINPEKEGVFHFIGFVLLMMLAVFIGYRDIIRFTNIF